jgi:hypothetical protein
MIEIEQEIAAWRRQMVAGGIESPQVLDELESHLRDDMEEQMRAGLSAREALATAVERLGQAGALECEFEKVGETRKAPERVKNAILTLAGVPNEYLNEPMNRSSANIEPRWATYLKATAFLVPALSLWLLSTVYLIPKLQQISAHAGGHPLPRILQVMLAITEHSMIIFSAIILLLVLLEWRSAKWPRYRRATIGFGTFLLNGVILISIFMMVVAVVLVAPALMRHGQ